MQGRALPKNDDDAETRGFDQVLTQWDSELFGVGVHLRTITDTRWTLTVYGPGYVHDGTEGELYDLEHDPLQRRNLWGDPDYAAVRSDLVASVREHEPPAHEPRFAVEAPV